MRPHDSTLTSRWRRAARPAVREVRASGTARGFTIVEVMMAAAVMAFAITTSITTMQRAFLALDSARNITTASQIMQSELERMRLKNWSEVSSYPARETLTIDASFANNPAIAGRFRLQREVTQPVLGKDMKQITLTVRWRSYDGRELSRSYTTHYGRNGLYDYFYSSF